MDFSISSDVIKPRRRTTNFIRERVIPLENDPRQSSHAPDEALRTELIAMAREQGC